MKCIEITEEEYRYLEESVSELTNILDDRKRMADEIALLRSEMFTWLAGISCHTNGSELFKVTNAGGYERETK
jgi:anaerobic selenocysteine-containing dehydrogenase